MGSVMWAMISHRRKKRIEQAVNKEVGDRDVVRKRLTMVEARLQVLRRYLRQNGIDN